MKKFGFFCFDVAGGTAMEILAKEAEARSHEVILFPKQEVGLAQKRGGEVVGMDAMLTGLSSFQTEEELAFAEVCDRFGVPWYIFEDVPGASLRPKARSYAGQAKLVFLAHLCTKEAARDFGYNSLVYLGPPPQWRLEYQTIKDAQAKNVRAEMQKVIGGGSPIPVQDADILIGAVGGKDPKENNRVLWMLVGAVKGLHRAVICFSEHPGEKPKQKTGESDANFAVRLAEYEKFMKEREEILSDVWSASPRSFNGAQVAGSADVMVFFSGTNIQIGAAFARIPNVSLDDEGFRARIRAQSGQEKWFVNELGGSMVVKSGDGLASAIKSLLVSDIVQAHLLEMQEVAFPIPDDWNDPAADHTETKIIKFLEQVL